MFNVFLALAGGACVALACLAIHFARRARALRARATDAEQALNDREEREANEVASVRRIEAQLLENQQRLDHLAHHDPLTGLPNRLYLAARLPDAIETAKQRNQALAVLFLDLDHFKHVNDTRGHEVGDKLLREVAARIRASVRETDLVVRMGGDEFIVVLEQIRSADRVHDTAARITNALAAPVVIDGRPVVTTTSIGVSLYPRDGADAGALLRHSDTAMYQAKEQGRNNFQLFSPAMDRKLKERVAVEASLRAAIAAGHLDVFYQPLLDVRTRRVVALEALVRWRHPKSGLISPARFIPVAEETGLIVPIGEFVLQRALSDVAAWRADGAEIVPIAINVSARQLRGHDLRRQILDLTLKHDLSPTILQIELTESAMIDDGRSGDAAEDIVDALRELGVGISIDDFGTGYSSLSYLKRWPVDTLKIDRSFVRDIVSDSSDFAIVGAIIAMARHLQIEVVAEGVEGWPQLEALRKLGCRYAQGFLFSEPRPAAEARRFLTGRPMRVGDEPEPAPARDPAVEFDEPLLANLLEIRDSASAA
jgi:diguanylate cyclase (GGDEF)-like protein